MRENTLKLFQLTKRKNNDEIVKMIGKIRIEENRKRSRSKKK